MFKSVFLREIFRTAQRELTAGIVISLAINLLNLVVPLYMLQVYSRVLFSRSYFTLIGLTAVALMGLAALGLLMVWRDKMMERLSAQVEVKFSDHIVSNVMKNVVVNNAPRSTEVLRDVDLVRQFLSGPQMTFVFDMPFLPIFLIFLLVLNLPMGLVAVVGAVISFVMTSWSEASMRIPMNEAQKLKMKALGEVSTMVRNAEVVEAMGMRGRVLERWRRSHSLVLAHSQVANDRANYFMNFIRTYRFIFQIVMVVVGVLEVLNNVITPGAMFVGSIIMGRTLMPIEGIIGMWKNILMFKESLANIDKTIQAFPPEKPHMPLPPPTGKLLVQNVSYSPPGSGKLIVRGINLALEPGDCLGLIGPSGSGKTTLGKLIVGAITPGSGSVRMDGADIAQWNSDDLGRYVGYLPQEIELFNGTVRENIGRLDADAPPEEIIRAAQMAGVHELILGLPEGYDTRLGEGAHVLSGGQRQRIGLARALYGQPRLLVLDEPNSNLDVTGEQALAKAIAELKTMGSTVIVIAHRPSILNSVDKILVMRGGTVEMFGSQADILPKVMPGSRPRIATG